jgi:exonuclease VII small subunit
MIVLCSLNGVVHELEQAEALLEQSLQVLPSAMLYGTETLHLLEQHRIACDYVYTWKNQVNT